MVGDDQAGAHRDPAAEVGGAAGGKAVPDVHDGGRAVGGKAGQTGQAGPHRVAVDQPRLAPPGDAAELQRRIGDAEVQLRSQVQALAADAEAERTALSARLGELQRRLDALLNEADSRLAPTFRPG